MIVIGPDKPGGPKRHRGEYQTHISHLVPSMGPTVSCDLTWSAKPAVVAKADQSAKPGIATVHR